MTLRCIAQPRWLLLWAALVLLIVLSTVAVLADGDITWTAKASLPFARFGLAAAAMNGKVYAFGGCSTSEVCPSDPSGELATAAVDEFDPAMNTWSSKAPMPTARSGVAAAAVSEKIYVFGGVNGTGVLATVEEYTPATNTWATKAPMSTPRR